MSATGRPREAIACKKIFHVAADGRGHVLLQVFLGLVFGIFVQLILHVAVDRLALADGA